jgi:hypothetical protein
MKKKIHKGVEVNYDSACKISDYKVEKLGFEIYKSDTSVYYPPTTSGDCDKLFSLPFQQLFTNRKIYLLSSNDESAALIQKDTKKEEYVLVDKTFGQKGDNNEYDFSELKNNFLKFLKDNKNNIFEGVKFSNEHLIAKRLGDAGQALAALYLTNSVLVTHDRILVAFALFIGVKHIIHCHPDTDNINTLPLTLYYDKTYGVNEIEIINNLNKKINILKIEDFTEKKNESLDNANKSKNDIEKAVNTAISNSIIVDKDADKYAETSNNNYTMFINTLNKQLIEIVKYKILKQISDHYVDYSSNIKILQDIDSKIDSKIESEKNDTKMIKHLNNKLSILTTLQKIKGQIDNTKVPNLTQPKNISNLKIMRQTSLRQKLLSFIPTNQSDFEKDLELNLTQLIFLKICQMQIDMVLYSMKDSLN